MQTIKLGEIAKIDISNVDKKTKETETPVVLCNFVDVYYNWAITSSMIPSLMTATANVNQIERFSIHKGQVAITKDSETRDDIGVATYIADDVPNGVLGYHCALITPDESILSGKYLNVLLHSPYAQKYFEANASGSGQRYTLTAEIIAGLPVPLPNMEVQKKIGKIFSDIDRKIENNTAINIELEALAKTVYDYWFLQFEFPDENGNPYKSSGGKMVWCEELKQNIPEHWKITLLSELAEMQMKSITPDKSKLFKHYSIPAFDDTGMPVSETGAMIDSNKYLVPNNSILVSKLNPQFKRIWNVGEVDDTCICSTEFMPFLSLNNQKEYLYSVLNSASFYKYMVQSSSSSTGSRKRMQPELCMEFKFASPTDSKLIDDYCEKVGSALDRIIENKKENQELASLRDFLLPLLMNGQVTFSDR